MYKNRASATFNHGEGGVTLPARTQEGRKREKKNTDEGESLAEGEAVAQESGLCPCTRARAAQIPGRQSDLCLHVTTFWFLNCEWCPRAFSPGHRQE